ncbi:hypothetical protein BN871_AT_00810 [Paenibacillus sp. P22]|nr:hypothetical protein BN871_AT_00810 [Paenibacillus sp. P22]
MRYICSCGNESHMSYKNAKKGRNCADCGRKKLSLAKVIYTHDYVSQFFADAGCVLLDEYRANPNEKLRYVCKCGTDSSIRWSHFMRGHRCQYCRAQGNKKPHITDDERITRRLYQAYREWRTEVFERDGYRCRCCGESRRYLNAHHILNYAEHRDRRVDVTNGVTLCKTCHDHFHRLYGRRNNNEVQLSEFIREVAV